ncbi:peptide synthetase, putative [Bodo saltans]|uniref:Peptide synthetase, putative n=1 Tax=Bodo saltans TaxID=75058 RepID=A0A0S4J1X7_BODSA|nr:peptide synthetase, putative [Bodo saltans]|eukprot:CUG83477.1 peptide synthetase, putative [Bodo saltans]
MQLIVSADLRRIAGLSPPVNTVVLSRGEVLQSAVSTSLLWSVAGKPIVVGPILPADGSAAALFRKFPSLTSFPVVFAPRETGVASVAVVSRDGNVERDASGFGLACAGAHLTLVPLHNSTDVDVPTGKVGQVVVSSRWLKANGNSGLRIEECYGVRSSGELVMASPQDAAALSDAATSTTTTTASQPGLRLTKMSTTSASSAVGTPEEELVKELFSEVLEIPKKTLTNSSDFFDVGGDSFTLSQLANRMQSHGAKFTVAVLINKILRDMTVHGVAQLLTASTGAPQTQQHRHQDPVPSCSANAPSPTAAATTATGPTQPESAARSRSNSLIKTSASKTLLSDEGEVDWENEIND